MCISGKFLIFEVLNQKALVMSKLSGEELQKEMSRFVNSTMVDKETFIEGLKNDHRTLQQSQVRLFLEAIEAMAEVEYTDARNQNAVLTCKRIVELFEKENGYKPSQGLPTI